jgi:hypothetical protein
LNFRMYRLRVAHFGSANTGLFLVRATEGRMTPTFLLDVDHIYTRQLSSALAFLPKTGDNVRRAFRGVVG